MSDRALIVVSRVASGMAGDGFADLSPENRARAQRTNEDPDKPYPSEAWLAERAKILEQVTAPAMRRVTAPHTWVWRTCPERTDQAREIRDRVAPNAVVLDDKTLTSDEVAPDARRFLTVRLDSDDAILPAALNEAATLDLPPRSIVNWWRGWQWNLTTGELATKEWPIRVQGPFLGVTHEDRTEMLQAGVPHTYARDGRKPVHVKGRKWIQTLHERNQLSRWQERRPLKDDARAEVFAQFGIQP